MTECGGWEGLPYSAEVAHNVLQTCSLPAAQSALQAELFNILKAQSTVEK